MDYFDVIHTLLPDIDLKFRIDRVGPTNIQVICGVEILPTLYTALLNVIKDDTNTIKLSAFDNQWCFDISFGSKDNAKKFAKDYISQKSKDISKIAVIDNRLGEVICAGVVRGMKHSDPVHRDLMLVSMDGMYYFHLDETSKYHLEWYEGDSVIFTEPDDYVIVPWLKSPKNNPAKVDVYRDYSYNELDPEVEPLVRAMNMIPGICTTGSCCGHNEGPIYVSFSTSSIRAINLLSSCLAKGDSGYYNKFYLELPTEYEKKYAAPSKKDFLLEGKRITVRSILTIENLEGTIQMTLISKVIGEEAYNAAELLSNDIIKKLEVEE